MLKNTVRKIVMVLKLQKLITKVYKMIFLVASKLPPKSKLVMFESFHGKQYSDNPRAIYEYLKENGYDYKMYWGADSRYVSSFNQEDIQYVSRLSIKWIYLMARAKYWVTNSRLPLWIPKPKHTIYLQTWHGTPLKRLATDMEEVHMPGTDTKSYKENFVREANKWDYLISPNAYSTKIFRRAFDFHNIMIESGYPRNDYLSKCNNIHVKKEIKLRLGIPEDKKVILYAPTWRDNEFYSKGKYKFDIKLDLDKMKRQLGENYVIILRMHYLIAENINLEPYSGFAIDVSQHSDIRELYLISDLLITDYSSVFFDYGVLKRPIIFFVYDIDNYRDTLRGFYFDLEEDAPGPLVKSSDEIIGEINKLERNNFIIMDNFYNFHNKFCYLEDGDSTKRVVDKVFN
jgi:CDP-glycerol glycerophosphotransferase